jgi:predicted AlkP superfamily pyrophosphatase or phosphodiesterase
MPATGLVLEPADRVCVFLVDGLGWELIERHPDEAPYLRSLLPTSLGGTGRPLTAGFPATTATSLASVGTGLPPGAHGLAGYTTLDPATGELMNQLRWQPWTSPAVWQPHPTVFRLAAAAGIATGQVSSPTFATTPLTKVALSGGTFHGRLTGEERMDLAADLLGAADRALVYTYYSELDAMGHRHGVDSDAWRGQLAMVDRLAQRLAEQLPPRSALYVTADHGMIDIPFDEESRIDFDEDWELRAGVAVLGGEARARHVYAVPGAAADVLAVWREVLGDRMWVAGREEAVAAGWFGPGVEHRVLPRIGDVVAVARDDVAVVALRSEPGESRMVGLHGSMAPVEQLVPLLEVRS